MLKAALRPIVAGAAHLTGLCLERLKGRVLVLAYHRVITEAERLLYPVQPGMYVLAPVFERQMAFVLRHFEVISLTDLVDRWQTGRWNPARRYCVITFDDGWRDNYSNAMPVLVRHGMPATVFLVTSLVGTNAWFWPDRVVYAVAEGRRRGRSRLETSLRELTAEAKQRPEGSAVQLDWMLTTERALRTLRGRPYDEIQGWIERFRRDLDIEWPAARVLLNWEEVDEMRAAGIAFGSHSHSHRILTTCDDTELDQEVLAARDMLRQRCLNDVPLFCYPNGSYDDRVAASVRAAGYAGALTMDFGSEPLGRRAGDLFRIRRAGVHNDITRRLAEFSFHVSGLGHAMRDRMKSPARPAAAGI